MKRILTGATLTGLLLAGFSTPAPAQCPTEVLAQQARLRSPTPGTDDYFGAAVDIDGDTAVVGAYYDNLPNKSNAGSARVFVRSNDSWTEQMPSPLTASNAGTSDYFGISVAVDGDLIVVGAHGEDSLGTNSGLAYVFSRSGTNWSEVQTLQDPIGAAGDRFGIDVAISGDTIVVGAPTDDIPGYSDRGSALVFRWDGANWIMEGRLEPPVPEQGMEFGQSVAIDGDTAIVGAYLDNIGSNVDQGSVYVYERSGSVWNYLTTLVSPTGATKDYLGYSVAIDGDRIVAGAYLDNDSGGTDQGSAEIFSRQFGPWAHEAQLLASNAAPNDRFGLAVDVDGDMIVIGALYVDVGGVTNTGAIYVYSDCGGQWLESTRCTAWDAQASDYFGHAVALSGRSAIVGAYGFEGTATNEGAAYVEMISQGDFELYGFGDGTGTPCPCANNSNPDMYQGCVNSNGFGANLSLWGHDSISQDDLIFVAGNLKASSVTIMFAGPLATSGSHFYDGLMYVGGKVQRLGVRVANAEGGATWGPGVAALGGWSPGDTRRFQVWYRDPAGPCGTGANLSSGTAVTFTP